MKKFFMMLLLSVLFLPGMSVKAETVEDCEYSKTIDEIYEIDKPQWSIYFLPEYEYKFEFWIFSFGRSDTYEKWNVHDMYFSGDFVIDSFADVPVGCELENMNVRVDVVYSSIDRSVSGTDFLDSSATFVYALYECLDDSGKLTITFPYEDLLSGSEYYARTSSGYGTVVKSVKITLCSDAGTCGTSVVYDFVTDSNYNKHIYTGISYSEYNDLKGLVFVSDAVSYYQESQELLDAYMFTVPPGTGVSNLVGLLDFVQNFVTEFPGMMLDVVSFLFNFIQMMPVYICKLVPFLPVSLVSFIVYALIFGFLITLLGTAISGIIKAVS